MSKAKTYDQRMTAIPYFLAKETLSAGQDLRQEDRDRRNVLRFVAEVHATKLYAKQYN